MALFLMGLGAPGEKLLSCPASGQIGKFVAYRRLGTRSPARPRSLDLWPGESVKDLDPPRMYALPVKSKGTNLYHLHLQGPTA